MKQYNNEKAIISLTSWKKRIDTVWKTLYTLLKQCPGFHIVLVLSEEEFSNKENDLPISLKQLLDNDIIEVLWVKKNLKALKKILYTMEKYPDIPIISADDDCLYVCNYAQELYDTWLKNPGKFITVNTPHKWCTAGPNSLFPPHCFGDNVVENMENNTHLEYYQHADDAYYEMLRCKLYKDDCQIIRMPSHRIWYCGDETEPMRTIYCKPGFLEKIREIQSEDCGFDVNYIFNQK